jgi:protein TonB
LKKADEAMRVKTQSFGRFIMASTALHLAVIGAVFLLPGLLPVRASDLWGSEAGREGGVRVTTVESIPGIELPSPPVVHENAVPADSKTLHPPEPAAEPRVEAKPEVLIASKTAKPAPAAAPPKPAAAKTKAVDDAPVVPSNAVPGAGGQAAIPYGQQGAGTGQTTFSDEAFGTRYGWYVQAMTNAIKGTWQPGQFRGTASRFFVVFTIARDGKVSNFKVDTSSGDAALDASAERAVLTAPIPSLPRDYLRPSVDVRFFFEYAR